MLALRWADSSLFIFGPSPGDGGHVCQLGVEEEQQCFVVRERHPVGFPGVTAYLFGESNVVVGLGGESAVAGERSVHDASLATLGVGA
jgi:hypothetical protein